jgi:hypothetical protein
MMLVHCFLLEGVTFGELLCDLGAAALGVEHYGGAFVSLLLLLISFWLCASVMSF